MSKPRNPWDILTPGERAELHEWLDHMDRHRFKRLMDSSKQVEQEQEYDDSERRISAVG